MSIFSGICIFFSIPIMDLMIRLHINAFEKAGVLLVPVKGSYSESNYVSGTAYLIMLFINMFVFYRLELAAQKEKQLYELEPVLPTRNLVNQYLKLDVALFILLVMLIILSNIAYERYLQLLFLKVYPSQLAVAHRYAFYCGASFFFSTVPNLILFYFLTRISIKEIYTE